MNRTKIVPTVHHPKSYLAGLLEFRQLVLQRYNQPDYRYSQDQC